MSTARRVLGGLLVGTGEGIVEVARARREEALRRFQEDSQAQREEARDQRISQRQESAEGRADARSDKDFNRRKGLLSTVLPDEQGRLFGITQGGEKIDLDIISGRSKDRSTTGLSVEDQRELNSAIERHTSGKGSIEGESTDWDAVAKRLTKNGRPDLAARVSAMESGSTGIDIDSAEYREAQRMAEDWASGKAGLFRGDKKDFADYGGSRAEAIKAKTLENYRELTGVASGSGSEPSATTLDAGGSPPGSGTQSDPYRATSQQDIDWFKTNAPAGAVIEVDGQLYQK